MTRLDSITGRPYIILNKWLQLKTSPQKFAVLINLYFTYNLGPKKSPVSGLRAHCLKSARLHFSHFILFVLVMKRCPTFSRRGMNVCRFVRPLLALATILCPRVYTYFPAKKEVQKSASTHRFWSQPMTRNGRLSFGLMPTQNYYLNYHFFD